MPDYCMHARSDGVSLTHALFGTELRGNEVLQVYKATKKWHVVDGGSNQSRPSVAWGRTFCSSPSDHAHVCVPSLNRSQGENCRDTVIPSHETLSSSCPPPHTHTPTKTQTPSLGLSAVRRKNIDNESPQLSTVSFKHESAWFSFWTFGWNNSCGGGGGVLAFRVASCCKPFSP